MSVVELVEVVDVCPIVDCIRFDMATLLMAWNTIKCQEGAVVSFASISQLMPFFMQNGTVFVFSEESFARVVQSGKNVLVPSPRLLEVPFLKPVPLTSLMQCKADEYMHHLHKVPMPQCVSDFPVFVPNRRTASTSAARILSAEPPTVTVLYALDMPASEARHYQAACASLLSALDVIEWGRPNPAVPGPLDSIFESHSVGRLIIFYQIVWFSMLLIAQAFYFSSSQLF